MEVAPSPTVQECCEWVSDNVLALETDDDVAIELDSLSILVNALDAPIEIIQQLQQQIHDLKKIQKTTLLDDVIKSAQEICNECRKCITAAPSFINSCFIEFNLELPRILPVTHPTNYSSMWPDQMDPRAYWFRQYFVGKPYITFIGRDETQSYHPIIISVVKERIDSKFRYRIISRGKQIHSQRYVVQETIAKETESNLELAGQGYFLDNTISSFHQHDHSKSKGAGGGVGNVGEGGKKTGPTTTSQPRRRPLRSISSAIINKNNGTATTTTITQNLETRLFRAAVRSTCSDIDLRLFRELSAEETILSGLEKGILRYDEMEIPKFYKFGVLSVKEGQTTEEEWFANSNVSESLERFLNIIGRPIELEGYKGYAAGLDTKSGESGKFSYATSWRDYEIMFHVAPLMPCRENDKQQVHRKRYIGNDIVCIVFVEGNECNFDPDIIRSQFLHVYIVIHPEMINGKEAWRIQVINKKNVSECTPLLPSPSIIFDENELRGFLMLKMVNAENAALKCDSFSIPNNKGRIGVLKTLSETGLRFNYTTDIALRQQQQQQQQHCNYYDGNNDRMIIMGGERPKSAGAQRISRGSMRSLRAALTENNNHHPRAMTPDAPPIPTTSRSSMLRDWKNLTRRRSSGGHSPIDSNSISGGSSRGPSPLLTNRPILLDDTEVENHNSDNNNLASTTATTTIIINKNHNDDDDTHPSLVKEEKEKETIRNSANSNQNNNDKDNNHRRLSNEQPKKQKQHNQTSQGTIRSKAQNLVTSVMGRRNSHQQQQQQQQKTLRTTTNNNNNKNNNNNNNNTSTGGGLIRSKTFMMDHAGKLIQGVDRHEKL
ncbi:hypothetical protein BDC45DRAFT_500213 [Circinella umbellata]|nr:hypothetical protein BDC45DRAFT_500213 [Circinella umbellata]